MSNDTIDVPQYVLPEKDVDKRLQISLNGIEGALTIKGEAFERVTCFEQIDLNVTANMAVPDRMFSLPIKRIDSGRIYLYPAFVKDGILSVIVRFPVSGQYRLSDEEINMDMEGEPFHISPINIDVLIDTRPKTDNT